MNRILKYSILLLLFSYTGIISAQSYSDSLEETYGPVPVVPSIDIAPNLEEENQENKVYFIVEKMPEFPGGFEKRTEYLAKKLKYPKEALEAGVKGKVFVEFIVEKDGSITNIKTLRGIGYGCNEEAERVIKKMPKWTPGEQRGKKVRVKYIVPITFIYTEE